MIMASAIGITALALLPETFVPVLLTQKAQKLRFETKNWALHSKQEETPVDLKGFITRYLTRPFVMLIQEPILLLLTIYISFVYGMLSILLLIRGLTDPFSGFIYLLFE